MKRWHILALAAAMTVSVHGLLAQTAPDEPVRALLTQGEYTKAIMETDKILRLQGDSLTDAQLYTLQMLKAESLLQSKRIPQAIAGYVAAMRVAPDLATLMTARGTQVLLSRATATNYVPKTGTDRAPIDILDAESRKKAMAALVADTSAEVNRDADRAISGTTLTAAENAFAPLLDFFAVQYASGADVQASGKLLRQLADHVHSLLSRELKALGQQVRQADRSSMMYDDYSSGGRRGLTSKERDELRGVEDYIDQIEARLQLYRQTSSRLGGSIDRWDSLLAQYSALRSELRFVVKHGAS